MSLSQERPTNPSKTFLKIKSGSVVYYDKDAQMNVPVPTPLEFIVLDQLATIRGWCDADESGYWSNEVRSAGRDVVTVRTSKGVKESGIWRDIKNSSSLSGAKYNASLYIAHKHGSGMAISNLALAGAALNSWIEFTQKNKIRKAKVILSDWQDAKKGAVSYKVPVFEVAEMTEDEKEQAVELDKELQTYLNEYFSYVPEELTVGSRRVEEDDEEEEPINLADIPF